MLFIVPPNSEQSCDAAKLGEYQFIWEGAWVECEEAGLIIGGPYREGTRRCFEKKVFTRITRSTIQKKKKND